MPLNNTQTLKFKAQLTIALFAAVNYNYDDNQRTLKKKINKQTGSKSTNHNPQTWPFEPVEVNLCFPRLPLR